MPGTTDLQQRVLESLHSVVLLFDRSLRLRYINPAGEMLFEASSRHLLNSPINELIQMDDSLHHALHDVLETGHPFTKHETRLMLMAQREVTVDMVVSSLREAKAEPELLVEMNRLDRLLRITRDESLLMQQKTTQELLRGLAHEVKNPLGGLRGAAQLLEKELPDDDLVEYTRVIIDEADRLQTLVNRILGPNKLPKIKPTNIHEVLERVRSLLLAEKHVGLTIKRDYDPSIPDIEIDPDQLIQAVLNIMRNACQALEDTGEITLRTRILRKYTIDKEYHRLVAKIDIMDNGPGIPADIKERIFFPMITGRAEGSGLGLSIAQSLIQQHGGLIECESEPGNTVFSIILPLERRTDA
ncbi:MAG: nitrogen regulation protein NR(II) [Gammaproteobacteria bacterium]|nr:nitrogen regulation protein NR(II) [Gammaproteobacteria bacterium]MDH5653476.1 nitrogen regulation protein NR(II) [Gammaproteobacteria bacterium]